MQALRRCGLRQLVLCPGSRSGPLAVAAALLEPFGLMLTTALDERSAAFFALGLGRGDGVAAAVVTTSGTAVANLLPAAVEADYSAIPLLLLTADRPAQLKGTGANQTVNQEQFLWGSCRRLLQGDPSGLAAMEPEAIELLALSAWEAAQGKGPERPAGPVHLNLPFDEPLHLGGEALIALARELASAGQWEVGQALAGSALGRSPAEAAGLAPELPFDLDRPGVIVAGPWRGIGPALRPLSACWPSGDVAAAGRCSPMVSPGCGVCRNWARSAVTTCSLRIPLPCRRWIRCCGWDLCPPAAGCSAGSPQRGACSC
ncbi:thiamine pyrophosphate-binding protein [Cyanobium sp. ATX-6F1]|uniref:thiamine pyrophosphate-binding protein n=1 Tax=Cyanobium sp. ATX-6F1 TaxID=3137388 RepID=UPI0039BE3AE1